MIAAVLACFALMLATPLGAQTAAQPAAQSAVRVTAEQVFSYAFPNELTAASKVGRIAWAFNEQGRRNIWVAEAPAFAARQLTTFDRDDGQELTSVGLSAGGEWVVFVRGGDHGSNWDDGVPVNATSSPIPPKVPDLVRALRGRRAEAAGRRRPAGRLAARRRRRVRARPAPVDGADRRVAARKARRRRERDERRCRVVAGRLAPGFRVGRGDHAFIGMYRDERRPSPGSRPPRRATGRRAGLRTARGSCSCAGREPAARRSRSSSRVMPRGRSGWPTRPAVKGGSCWKAPETLRGSFPTTHGNANLHWAARGRIVFLSYHGRLAAPVFDCPRAAASRCCSRRATTWRSTSALSPDGTHLVFAGNAGDTPDDIDRRHVVKVPVDRAAPQVMTPGTGLEWTPVVAGDRHIAFIGATAQRPPLPMVMPLGGGAAEACSRPSACRPTSRTAQLVVPKAVTYKASDGVTVHAQLFEAPGGPAKRAGDRLRPRRSAAPDAARLALLRLLLAARTRSNQYLASRGFVVLSINYRLGIGYGYEFHRPPAAGAQGASEYLDVKAAAEYLRTLPQVDRRASGSTAGRTAATSPRSPWRATPICSRRASTSTGCTTSRRRRRVPARRSRRAMAQEPGSSRTIARRPRRWRGGRRPCRRSSTWKSPVLLIHGDEDRNVRFSQTVDLARRL